MHKGRSAVDPGLRAAVACGRFPTPCGAPSMQPAPPTHLSRTAGPDRRCRSPSTLPVPTDATRPRSPRRSTMSLAPTLTLDTLRAAVRGPVLTAEDDGYAAESACFNAAVIHTPDVVIGATSADDVVATVRWAAEHGLPVAV